MSAQSVPDQRARLHVLEGIRRARLAMQRRDDPNYVPCPCSDRDSCDHCEGSGWQLDLPAGPPETWPAWTDSPLGLMLTK